jgi:DNA-binding beta-propeller fold protein YncE
LLGLAILPLLAWGGWRLANNASNPKFQTPNSKETPNFKTQTSGSGSVLAVWSLRLPWCLVFGVWCFTTGCAPRTSDDETAIRSQFFERAAVFGTRGVGIGEFNKPRSVAVDLQDNIYAVDMTGRVQKFSPAGKFLLTWQMPETDLGKAKGMGRDPAGNIIVIEPHYQRVNHYAPDGMLVSQWGCRGTNEGCFILPRGVAVNSRGEFLVSEYMGSERVQRFALKVQSLKSEVQSQEVSSTNPLTPALSLSEGERGNRSPSLVKLVTPRLLQVIGKAGTGPGEFNRPEGICVDAQDRIYVADSCNHRIQIFSADGKFIRQYGTAGSGLGELSYPYDVAVDAHGYQFVCEFGNSRIQVFDPDCEPVEIIGGPGSEPGQFANPWAVALDSQGNLVVADGLNHRVQKLVRKMGPIGPMRRMEAAVAKGDSRITHHASR